ncbi:MAG: glycoside hydrolase family 31 protein [Actinomycetaceae bacterium]|nr:glycoside hydrolase family 31 protein [Actinomycetaceae bacterium]MDY5272616.1 glycoside hydrolase family 31 protein [Arcanobacterium sp.]
MIRHNPIGSGHAYSPDTEQRWPVTPVAGEQLRIGVRTNLETTEVTVQVVIDGSECAYSLQPVPRFSRGQLSDGGHLASAQAKRNRSAGGWEIHLDVPTDTHEISYRFHSTSPAGSEQTKWYRSSIAKWKVASDDVVTVLSQPECASKMISGSVRTLDDGEKVYRVKFALRLEENEHIAGFGERYDYLDQRGHALDSVVFEQYKSQGSFGRTYFPMPFAHVVGADGWGWYVHTSRRVWFDVAAAVPGQIIVEAEVMQPYSSSTLITISQYSGDPAQVLRQFLDEVGHPRELPSNVFGLWASGNEWNTQREVMRQADLHQQYDIPISHLVIEAWSDETTFSVFRDAQYEVREDGSPFHLSDFTFPQDGAWPDPKGMVQELHRRGISVVLWQIPLLKMRPHPRAQALADADYAIANDLVVTRKNNRGQLVPYRNRGWWFPLALMPDFTNPECVQWWSEKRRYLVSEIGIDGFKTDGGEHAWGADLIYYDGSDGGVRNNEFPRYYAQAYCDLLESCGKPPLTFSRSGYVGSQAYGAFWAGDENSTWEAFRWSMIAGLNAAACGVLYWGWDIAGFSGEVPSAELYVRAMAASAFVPIMQYHSEFNHHKKPSRDRTPWNIAEQHNDPQVIDDVRTIVKLREKLRKYISAEASKAIQTSLPLMRPLYFNHPTDPHVWNYVEWYFGDSLLVAPVLEENATSWEVYLPEGNWVDVYSGKPYVGGQSVMVDVHERTKIPVFAKAADWDKLAEIFS